MTIAGIVARTKAVVVRKLNRRRSEQEAEADVREASSAYAAEAMQGGLVERSEPCPS